MGQFIEIFTIVFPVFLVIALGYFLRAITMIDDRFLFQSNRLIYNVCLPLLLFYKIGTCDFCVNFNLRLILGSLIGVFLCFLLSYFYAFIRHYPPADKGVFCQGAFRGNLAYVGLAIVFNAHGEDGITRAAILMGFLVPLLNVLSIIALLLPRRSSKSQGLLFWILHIIYNPLIIAAFVGILWSFANIPIPRILDRSLNIITDMTLPLALVAIGGGFSLKELKGDIYRAGLATSIKLLGLPLLTALLLYCFDVKGMNLSIGVLMAATPTATASYIFATQMKGNMELAGSIVMLTTLVSVLTYMIALFLLSSLNV